MFAVLTTGGKQYKVSQGDLIEVEKLDGNVGDTVTLEQVLMVVSLTPVGEEAVETTKSSHLLMTPL